MKNRQRSVVRLFSSFDQQNVNIHQIFHVHRKIMILVDKLIQHTKV